MLGPVPGPVPRRDPRREVSRRNTNISENYDQLTLGLAFILSHALYVSPSMLLCMSGKSLLMDILEPVFHCPE